MRLFRSLMVVLRTLALLLVREKFMRGVCMLQDLPQGVWNSSTRARKLTHDSGIAQPVTGAPNMEVEMAPAEKRLRKCFNIDTRIYSSQSHVFRTERIQLTKPQQNALAKIWPRWKNEKPAMSAGCMTTRLSRNARKWQRSHKGSNIRRSPRLRREGRRRRGDARRRLLLKAARWRLDRWAVLELNLRLPSDRGGFVVKVTRVSWCTALLICPGARSLSLFLSYSHASRLSL